MLWVSALASLVACEGLIGASFDRTLRPDAADGGDDDGGTTTDEAGGRDAATDAKKPDAKPTSNDGSVAAPSCGDTGGLDMTADWPMVGYCPTRPGRSLAPTVAAPRVQRRFTLTPTGGSSTLTNFASGVAIDGAGIAYALITEIIDASIKNSIVAIDGTKEAWRTDVTSGLAYVTDTGTPVLAANGNIYVAVGGSLFALSRDGKVSWSKAIGSAVGAPLVLGDGTIVVTSGTVVRAFTPSGADAWSFGLDGSSALFFRGVTATPSGALLVVEGPSLGSTDASLVSFNAGGSLNWVRPLTSGPSSIVVVDDHGQSIVRTQTKIAIFDATGNSVLSKAAGAGGQASNVFPALLPGGDAWFGDGSALLHLDAASGGTTLTARGGRHSSVVGTSDGDAIFAEVQTPDAHVVCVGPDGEERWSVPIDLNGGDLQPPALDAAGDVYVPLGETLFVVGP